MFRRFRDADIGTTIVLTIAVTVLCIGIAQYAFKSTEAHNLDFVFGNRTVTIADATITWDNVLQIILAVAHRRRPPRPAVPEPHRHARCAPSSTTPTWRRSTAPARR